MNDERCADCRKGHYFLAGGDVITNFPCITVGCSCWFCGPVKTPAQQYAWAAYRRSVGD